MTIHILLSSANMNTFFAVQVADLYHATVSGSCSFRVRHAHSLFLYFSYSHFFFSNGLVDIRVISISLMEHLLVVKNLKLLHVHNLVRLESFSCRFE